MKDLGMIKVMSFNIRYENLIDKGERSWKERAPHLIECIKKHNPDILGLQEVLLAPSMYILKELKDYIAIQFFRDGDLCGESCGIYFKRTRFVLVGRGGFWLSKKPNVPSKGWGAGQRRICNYAVLDDLYTGERFAVFNSHLDVRSKKARMKGAELIAQKIKAIKMPVIFVADANSEENDSSIKVLKTVMKDVKTEARETYIAPTFHKFHELPLNEQIVIDYCMVTDEFEAVSYEVDTDEKKGVRSDHNPIIAVVGYKK